MATASAASLPVSEAARRTRATPALAVLTTLAAAWLMFATIGTTDPIPSPAPAPTLRVDPNTAPPAVLAVLPRLGRVRVAAIVEVREARPFESPEDLEVRVKGIGPATLRAIRPYLRLDDSG